MTALNRGGSLTSCTPSWDHGSGVTVCGLSGEWKVMLDSAFPPRKSPPCSGEGAG